MALLVAEVPWPGGEVDDVALVAHHLGLDLAAVRGVQLVRRSVDGRRRPAAWVANYRVELAGPEDDLLARGLHGVRAWTARDEARYSRDSWVRPVPRQAWPSHVRPVVVGAGPAGLFAALRLAEAGARVTLLERGGSVGDRHPAVRGFWRHGQLDPENNVVFGEGGAGAFSDGKIYTRRRDGELGWVFQRLVDFGADPAILEEGWAHLGTDRIRELLPRLRARLLELSCTVRFHTRVDGLVVEGGEVVGVRLADGAELRGAPVYVAAGHSARDTWRWLIDAGARVEPRGIHVGARIEHPQRLVDQGRYGTERGDLPPASYRLSSRPPGPSGPRRAHTFCMCPGGTVVAASNHPQRVVVNGMSYSGRRAWFANSAVIVEVLRSDYPGDDPLAGVRFQDEIERRAFELGGGAFVAPAQRAADFVAGRESRDLPRTSHPRGVAACDLRALLPQPIVAGMVAALQHFERRIPGFAGPEGVLIAPETRTTAPLRVLRGPDYESTTLPGLVPLGEGAGFAGGIASAALDGYRAASVTIERCAPRRS